MQTTSLSEQNSITANEVVCEKNYPKNTSSEVLWAMSFIKNTLLSLPDGDLKKFITVDWSTSIPGRPNRIIDEDFDLVKRTNNFFEQNGVYAEHPNAHSTVANLRPTRIARYWFPNVKPHKNDILVWYNLVWWLYDDTVESALDPEQKSHICLNR